VTALIAQHGSPFASIFKDRQISSQRSLGAEFGLGRKREINVSLDSGIDEQPGAAKGAAFARAFMIFSTH
jgi:hypothetical protein